MSGSIALALDFITASELRPPELIGAAAANGCRSVSLLVRPHPAFPDHGLLGDSWARHETRRSALAQGIAIDMIEAFVLDPQTDVSSFRRAFECGAYLGATFVNTLARDPDEMRMIDNLAQFSELAIEFGLRPMIEFAATCSIASIASAVRAIERCGSEALTIEVDALALVRTGGTPADLLTIDQRLIGRAQINDGPLTSLLEPGIEALYRRQIPGQGEFPLCEFVEALPTEVTIGVEVPLRDLVERGVSGAERVRRAVAGARDVLAQTEGHRAPG